MRLVLLAPSDAEVPEIFRSIESDREQHARLLAEMQRLRGNVYLEDGAIEARQLSRDGRHCLSIDRESWHILALDSFGAVCGCVRYFTHPNTACFRELWVRNSAIASSRDWRYAFRAAVDGELRKARVRNLSYVEVGGWAISPERRCSAEALRTALATYSLAQVLGGCIGITTATVRHHSSTILRRIGGSSLRYADGELPPYYDPQYGCEMEVLRFDSCNPAPRFAPIIDRLCSEILSVPVICSRRRNPLWFYMPADTVHARTPYIDPTPALQRV